MQEVPCLYLQLSTMFWSILQFQIHNTLSFYYYYYYVNYGGGAYKYDYYSFKIVYLNLEKCLINIM